MTCLEILVVYDVSTVDEAGRKRLRAVARICEGYGQRVQKSVFEVLASPADWASLRARLQQVIDAAHDSVRYYRLPTGALESCIVEGQAAATLENRGPWVL